MALERAENIIDRVLAARQRYAKQGGGRRSVEESKRVAELARALVRELEDAGVYSFRLEEDPPRIVIDLSRIVKPPRRVEMSVHIVFGSEKGQAPHRSDDCRFITSRK